MSLSLLGALWSDEQGAVISAELVIVLTVLVLALVTGMSALRDAMVTEFGDLSAGIGSLDQSFSFGGLTGHSAAASGALWSDRPDLVDNDDPNAGSGGVVVCVVIATPEGSGPGTTVATDRGRVTLRNASPGATVVE